MEAVNPVRADTKSLWVLISVRRGYLCDLGTSGKS